MAAIQMLHKLVPPRATLLPLQVTEDVRVKLLWKEFWPSCHGYGGFARLMELENECTQDRVRRLRRSLPPRVASSGEGRRRGIIERWGTCEHGVAQQQSLDISETGLAIAVALGVAVFSS